MQVSRPIGLLIYAALCEAPGPGGRPSAATGVPSDGRARGRRLASQSVAPPGPRVSGLAQELIKLVLHNDGGGNEVFVTSSAGFSSTGNVDTWRRRAAGGQGTRGGGGGHRVDLSLVVALETALPRPRHQEGRGQAKYANDAQT